MSRVVLEDGTELHLSDTGTGPPVFLLHGGMGDLGSWPAQIAAFSPNHRVISYSRRYSSPNRNGNPMECSHSLEADVQDLSSLQRSLGTGPAHMVGTSYGALIALALALGNPQAVLSLALAEPPLHSWARSDAQGICLYDAFMQKVWQPAGAAFRDGHDELALQLLADGIAGYPVFDPRRRATALPNAGSMKALTQAADPFPDLSRAAVSSLPMPTLLIQGERCNGLHLRVMDELAHALPIAPRAIIPASGHGSPAENPADFNMAVMQFLARIGGN